MKRSRTTFRYGCFLILAAVLALILSGSAMSAHEGRMCGENLTWSLDDEGVLVISGTGEMDSFIEDKPNWGHFSIRRVIIEPGVTSIGALAFEYCHKLRSVEIPDTVTSIGDYAFSRCSLLKSVAIPDSVSEIGINPFHMCSSLGEILLSPDHPYLSLENGLLLSRSDHRLVCRLPAYEEPDCVIPAGTLAIGDEAFSSCNTVETLSIPGSVTSIGHDAFYDCTSLVHVDIPGSVRFIGYRAFSHCLSLHSLILREGLQSIGSRAFSYCWALNDLNLPDTLRELGTSPFYDCRSLSRFIVSKDHPVFGFENGVLFSKPDQKLIFFAPDNPDETYAVPAGIRIIGENAFQLGCGLRRLILPDSVVQLEKQAFDGCFTVEEIILPQGLKSIGAMAFGDMSGLREVVLPDGLISIGDQAFGGCSGLESVQIPESVSDIGKKLFVRVDTINLVVYAPGGSFAAQYCVENDLRTVPPGEEVPEPEAQLPAAFTQQFPGYTGLYQLETGSENEAVYLAQTPDDWLVLLCGTQRENGWTIVESACLPAESRVVLDSGLQLLDLGFARCSIRRYHDDVWGIDYAGWRDVFAGPGWFGYFSPPQRYYGVHTWADLTSIDWITLCGSLSEALEVLDVSSSATPDRPDPAATTPVFSNPDPDSELIADLFNGAPLFVVSKGDEWTHVRLGRDDGTQWKLDGWIRTRDLAFGKDINRDHFADIDWTLYAQSGNLITLVTPLGSEQIDGKDYNCETYSVIGEKTIDRQDYWLIYECYTEKPAFLLKDSLIEPHG